MASSSESAPAADSAALRARAGSRTRGGRREAPALIGVTGAALGALALLLGPYLSLRPNRVVDGTALTGLQAFGTVGWLLLLAWALVGGLALISPARRSSLARGLLGAGILAGTLWASGVAATEYAAGEGPMARTSFGWSFYVSLLGLYLVHHAAATDGAPLWRRVLVPGTTVAALAAVAFSGALSDLGIARELALARDLLAREITAHLFYALGATLGAVVIGVPLGIACERYRRIEGPVMGALNIGQVFPALAFVGLMMPVFGALGRGVEPLGALGVAGVGWAPVFVVLLVYALYPVVRNTVAAIRALDPAVVDAAVGMGMSPHRRLAEIELPLGFPVVLAGVRVALVQSTAGAVVAAFVGGGGLGAVMFFGLEQTSMDLVLVGVAPIVALALAFDTGIRWLEGRVGAARGAV
ncbi:MAG TPA: ABC transporter permease [Coriobacteriia bacterium]|nr:ABC transporter permease [Coriobacteriia bacterium]